MEINCKFWVKGNVVASLGGNGVRSASHIQHLEFVVFTVVVDVFFFCLGWLLLVKFVVLWVIDWVTIDWLFGWCVEVVWLEEVSEVEVWVLVVYVNIVILILGDVWEVTWSAIVYWCCLEWLWFGKINLGSTGVVEVVIPVPWCRLPVIVYCPWVVMVGWLSFISVFNVDSTYYCQNQVRCESFHSRYRKVITSELDRNYC